MHSKSFTPAPVLTNNAYRLDGRAPLKLRNAGLGVVLTGIVLLMIGCGPISEINKQERIVGERLQDVSLPDRDTGAMSHIALFDHTTHRIHQFDLNEMRYDRGLKVDSPDAEHVLLFHEDGNYIIDFADQTLSIYDSYGNQRRNPIALPGLPVSAAFRPRLGELAVYDSTNALGLLKLNSEGHVVSSWVGGPIVGSSDGTSRDLSLVSADITEDGRLIAALSDNSIWVLDFDQSIASHAWTATDHFSTTLSNITWLAPVRGRKNLILVKSDSGLNLINLTTHLSQSSYDPLSANEYLQVLSKSVDPHFILSDSTGLAIRVGYVDPGAASDGSSATIKTRTLNLPALDLFQSRLNIQTDSWIMNFNQYKDFQRSGTNVVSYRFSDLLSTSHRDFPTKVDVKLLEGQVFALYPSSLGHAVTFDVVSKVIRSFDNFNVGL